MSSCFKFLPQHPCRALWLSCELHKLSLLKFLLSGYCAPGTWREFRGCGFQGLNFQGQQGFLSQQIPYPMSHLTDLGRYFLWQIQDPVNIVMKTWLFESQEVLSKWSVAEKKSWTRGACHLRMMSVREYGHHMTYPETCQWLMNCVFLKWSVGGLT